MSSINLYGYTTQRISGLASGMDTDTIVENLLAAEQAKLDKVYQQKEKAQWKYDAYSELNSAVSSLRSSYLSVLGDNSLLKSSTYNAYTVNMEENSAIKVTGTTNALSSSFQVLSTTKAAAASRTSQVETQQTEIKGLSGQYLRAQVQGAIALEEGQTISETTTIGDLAAQFGLQDGESLSFSINGETFTLAQDTSLEALVGEVNASAAAASMGIDYATGTVAFASKTIGTDTKLEFSNITGAPFSSDGGFGLKNTDVHKESILGNAGAELDIASATFQDLAEATGLELTGNSFSVNGEAFDITDKSIQTVMDEVNARLEGVTMSYDENDGAFVLRNEPGANATASIQVSGALFGEDSLFGTEEGTYTDSGSVKREDTIAEAVRKLGETVEDEIKVTVNGKEFTFDTASTTLSDMMSTINRDKTAQAVFSYSEMTDSFQIANATTGSNSILSFSGLAVFGLADESDIQGTDAKLEVVSNGITKEITQSSNTFTFDGLAFQITGTKDFGEEGLSVNVERDYQPTIDTIKSFIADYNEAVGALTTKYYEKSYSSSYPPLTEEQRSAMTEEEGAKWDEKAMSGILRNDAAIGGLLSGLRSSLLAKVGDTGLSASDLGISTVAWSSSNWRTEQGKLTLDEDKLLAAFKENPNAVQEALTKISTTESGSTDTSTSTENGETEANSGLLVRMSSLFSSFNTAMRTQNIVDTQDAITGYTEKMADLIEKMAEKEESYWAKYSAMETALTQLQSQQSWLTAQLGLSTSN